MINAVADRPRRLKAGSTLRGPGIRHSQFVRPSLVGRAKPAGADERDHSREHCDRSPAQKSIHQRLAYVHRQLGHHDRPAVGVLGQLWRATTSKADIRQMIDHPALFTLKRPRS